jgi:hypothetical protein
MVRIGKAIVLIAMVLVLTLPILAQDETKIQGKIKSVTADKNEFVLTGKDDAKDYKFQLDLRAKVQVNKTAGKLEDLKTGDQVTVMYRKEAGKMMATKIQCTRK